MLKNYLKISLRKQPAYVVINIVGMAVGMACFILIGTNNLKGILT